MAEIPFIYCHADDYGMTPLSSQRIEECWKHGCINSVSVVPNGCLSEVAAHLREAGPRFLSIHLNLVEGKALSPIDEADLLADANGYMRNSFGSLLLLSLSPSRKRLETQLYQELKRQLFAVISILPQGMPLRLDSHQHTHMIPLVFHTLLRVIKDCGLQVSYIRIPAEPVSPFLRVPGLYKTYAPINIVKQLILNFMYLFIRKEYRSTGIPSAVFCGVLFSGNMDRERVEQVLPYFCRLAEKRGEALELLFHPGAILEEEPQFDPYKTSFHPFYRSSGRLEEYRTVHELHLSDYQ